MPQAMDPELQPLQPKKSSSYTGLSRENLEWVFIQLGAVVPFVGFGAIQAIATRASRGKDGVLPYDTAAAVTVSEALKLLVAVTWMGAMNRREFVWPIPRAWMRESMDLLFVAGLFAVTNELNFLVVEKLGAALFMILGNLKIVFTCVFMRTILGKHFGSLQWVAVTLLTFSAIVVKIPAITGMSQETQPLSHSMVIGFVFILISTGASGLASVKNELILKKQDDGPTMPFMAKNGVLYGWGIVINLTSWYLTGSHGFGVGFNSMAYLSIGCLVCLGLACAVILRYLDNVVRCFGSVGQVLMTVALSQMLPASLHEGAFDKFYTFSLVLLATALVLYQAHASPKLHWYLLMAASCALSVGILCSRANDIRIS